MTDRNPVLLIHGINDTEAVFQKMTQYLNLRGWTVHSLSLTPSNGCAALDDLARQVAAYIDRTFAADQPLDLVGFSMGGIVSRYYVQRLGGIDRVQRFITVASPHQGTWTGYLKNGTGCQQMRPHSEFLNDLNSDVQMLGKINFTSIWTIYDLMIVPPSSSQLPVGKEFVLSVPLHPWMITDPRSIAIIANELSAPFNYRPVPPPLVHRQSPLQSDFQKSPPSESNV